MSSQFGPTVAEILEQQALESQNIITEHQNPVAKDSDTSDNTNTTTQEETPKVEENNVPETENQDPNKAAPAQTVEVPIPAIQLTEKDIKKREQLETKVVNSVSWGWRALAEIQYYKDGILWKATHPTFEDYVAARFDFNRKHSMRLVEAGRFLLQLDKGKAKGSHPTRESHIREITQKLPESHRVQFWDKFCEANSITDKTVGEITAVQVKEAVVAYRKELPKDELPPKPARQKKEHDEPNLEKIWAKSVLLLEKVKVQVKEHPNKDSILEKLDELIELLNN
jgi:hypothetical protein